MIFDLQKANMFKRISAFLFDFIMRMVFVAGFAIIFSMLLGYDAKAEEYEDYYAKYEVEYGIDYNISSEEYDALPDEVKARYEEADKAFGKDPEVVKLYALLMNLTLLITIFSILLAYVVLEFIIPLCLDNGQTMGKKIFGVAVMRDDGVRITPMMLFVRAILGKCTVEALVPLAIAALVLLGSAGFYGVLALLLFVGLEVFLMVRTKTNSCIHDVLSYTVTVDLASQMIFENEEALIAYKNKIHKEAAERMEY